MAALPHELLKLSSLGADSRTRINQLYEKLSGLCRWFGVELNGFIFPADQGEPPVNGADLLSLFAAHPAPQRVRIEQFIDELRRILQEHGVAYEGAFEPLDPDTIADGTMVVKAVYTLRPFWRWY